MFSAHINIYRYMAKVILKHLGSQLKTFNHPIGNKIVSYMKQKSQYKLLIFNIFVTRASS